MIDQADKPVSSAITSCGLSFTFYSPIFCAHGATLADPTGPLQRTLLPQTGGLRRKWEAAIPSRIDSSSSACRSYSASISSTTESSSPNYATAPKLVPAKAGKSLEMFFRTLPGLDDGILGMIMVIHTFGDYARFHPHLHAIVPDGLFRPNGTFYYLPKRDLKELEEIFRSKAEGRISDVLIEKLMAWHHSGFSVHAGNQIARDDRDGQKALAEYILRNAFSEQKITYIAPA